MHGMNNATKRGSTILLIEDDEDAVRGMKLLLGREFEQVVIARTATEGLQAIGEHDPDVVILDLGLPDLDGQQLLEWIQETYDETPVIVLSARSPRTDKDRALAHGAQLFVQKPPSWGQLRSSIQFLLQHERAEKTVTH